MDEVCPYYKNGICVAEIIINPNRTTSVVRNENMTNSCSANPHSYEHCFVYNGRIF